jgi:hypothetical protein
MLGERRIVDPPVTVGPGHYDETIHLITEKHREAHIDPGSPEKRQEPGVGPGHYDAMYTLTKDNNRKAHIDPTSPVR